MTLSEEVWILKGLNLLKSNTNPDGFIGIMLFEYQIVYSQNWVYFYFISNQKSSVRLFFLSVRVFGDSIPGSEVARQEVVCWLPTQSWTNTGDQNCVSEVHLCYFQSYQKLLCVGFCHRWSSPITDSSVESPGRQGLLGECLIIKSTVINFQPRLSALRIPLNVWNFKILLLFSLT